MPIHLIPNPQSIQTHQGTFTLNADTTILYDARTQSLAENLARQLRPPTGFPLPTSQASDAAANTISLLIISTDPSLGQEGYHLEVTPQGVKITAQQSAGIQYGIQTLLQLLPHYIVSRYLVPRLQPIPDDVVLPEGWTAPQWEIPCVQIEDKPRFEWRGFMIDCSRHFMPVSRLKWCMDKMLQLKMNRLHLHLSDNHGWRVEIPSWPLLTERGARVEPEPRRQGFYSASDIRELVDYGQERNILLIPEIDIPGHIYAAVSAYPELCCTGKPRRNDMSHFHQLDILCAGNEQVYAFLEDVFGTLIDLFPGPYVHVGGDEAPKNKWRSCPKCQEMIRTQRLENESELQAYLIGRVSNFLRSAGRQVIAWDDVLQGNPQSDIIIHWWNSSRGVLAPLDGIRRGHRVICSRSDWSYFGSWKNQMEPFFRDGEYLPPEFTGFREESPAGHDDPVEWKQVMGAECCMWTETTPEEMLPARIFPAILANAELQWHYTGKRKRDLVAFERSALSLMNYFEGFDKISWGS